MSSTPSHVAPHHGPDFSSTYGAVLIGILVSAGLLGINVAQVFTYHNSFPRDKLILKATVYYVLILETLRLVLGFQSSYYHIQAYWGNSFASPKPIWTTEITLLLTALTGAAVRLFFTYRVWIIGHRNLYITAVLVTLCVADFCVGVATWGMSFVNPALTAYTPALHNLGNAALGLSVATDWSISLSLIYFLNRNRSGMGNTDTIINRVVFYTVNMGLITSCSDICVLALSLWPRPQQYSIALFQVVGGLYANSLLASLNSRIALRQNASENVAISDFSTFEAQGGNEPESTLAAVVRTDQSKEHTLTGGLVSSLRFTKLGSSKRDMEGSQSDLN